MTINVYFLVFQMQVTQQDLKVMMATIRENGTETKLHVEKIGKHQGYILASI